MPPGICIQYVKDKCSDNLCSTAFTTNRFSLFDRILNKAITTYLPNTGPIAPGVWCVINSCNETQTFVKGVSDLVTQMPFTEDMIIRLASESKLIGTIAFLKMVENGIVDIF